ncbi:methyltransferase [Streptomyces sp. MUSC 14]|uniref:class I SAM-dependent methyltransferase n=1 Tax=Streptomyces sp. MUSC 14 TaxID=1354889 RepID=UPI0008F58C84|nr:class I SAM-dependent methyltransferase [Streptomyces sp. MUSC 14]OIJ88147.1 methyltransferase [Streptomyces sp. MUSC 14]
MTLHPVTPAGPQPRRLASQYDALHAARARTSLVARLYAEAMGEDYPIEVNASSSCDWPLLGLMTARLRMRPGQLLMDAGCGNGGIGLWLARALAVRLIGFDISPNAVAQATARITDFVPAGQAAFHIARMEATGLPDSCVHGAVCVDAFGRADDRASALRELGRLLAPGGRLLLTRGLRPGVTPAWEEQARAAGLILECVHERPTEPAMWERLYRLWIDHADELRRDLGDFPARNMLAEAHRMLPVLPGRRAVLLALRRAGTSPAMPDAADTMAQPSRPHGGGSPSTERTPE